MISSKYRFSLDVHDAQSRACLDVKRGDTNSRTLYITLTEGGRPYHISEECYAVFTATKPDGNIVFNPCVIDDGTIIYKLTPQTTAAVGILGCEIKLYGADDALITSPGFLIAVHETEYEDGDEVESEAEVTALTHLISQAATAIYDSRETTAEGKVLIDDLNDSKAELEKTLAEAKSYSETATAAASEALTQSTVAERHAAMAEQAYEESDRMAGRASAAADRAEVAATNAEHTYAETERMATRAEQAAARAEEAADRAEDGSNAGQNVGLTTAQITALDNMFKVCAFVKADVSAEYSAFRSAFGIEGGEVPEEPNEPVAPTVTLTSISVTYAGGDVPVGTSVDDLNDIVVTAHYSDGSTAIVNDYTFSGTIAEGSNTITVTYQGKTATFTVTGVAESGEDVPSTPLGVEWTDGYLVSVSKATQGGLTANATWTASDYVDVSGKTEVRIYNDFGKLFTFQGCFYDADKQSPRDAAWYFHKKYVQGSAAYPSPLLLAVPDGAKYVRLSTSIQAGSASTGYVRYDALTYELA